MADILQFTTGNYGTMREPLPTETNVGKNNQSFIGITSNQKINIESNDYLFNGKGETCFTFSLGRITDKLLLIGSKPIKIFPGVGLEPPTGVIGENMGLGSTMNGVLGQSKVTMKSTRLTNNPPSPRELADYVSKNTPTSAVQNNGLKPTTDRLLLPTSFLKFVPTTDANLLGSLYKNAINPISTTKFTGFAISRLTIAEVKAAVVVNSGGPGWVNNPPVGGGSRVFGFRPKDKIALDTILDLQTKPQTNNLFFDMKLELNQQSGFTADGNTDFVGDQKLKNAFIYNGSSFLDFFPNIDPKFGTLTGGRDSFLMFHQSYAYGIIWDNDVTNPSAGRGTLILSQDTFGQTIKVITDENGGDSFSLSDLNFPNPPEIIQTPGQYKDFGGGMFAGVEPWNFIPPDDPNPSNPFQNQAWTFPNAFYFSGGEEPRLTYFFANRTATDAQYLHQENSFNPSLIQEKSYGAVYSVSEINPQFFIDNPDLTTLGALGTARGFFESHYPPLSLTSSFSSGDRIASFDKKDTKKSFVINLDNNTVTQSNINHSSLSQRAFIKNQKSLLAVDFTKKKIVKLLEGFDNLGLAVKRIYQTGLFDLGDPFIYKNAYIVGIEANQDQSVNITLFNEENSSLKTITLPAPNIQTWGGFFWDKGIWAVDQPFSTSSRGRMATTLGKRYAITLTHTGTEDYTIRTIQFLLRPRSRRFDRGRFV